MKWTSIVCGAVLATVGLASNASATVIVGGFNITGSVTLQPLPGGQFSLDFLPDTFAQLGNFTTGTPSTGYFTGLSNPTPPPNYFGTVKDIASTPTAGFATVAIGSPTSVTNFLDFSQPVGFTPPGFGTLGFDLTFIPVATAPICTGFEAVNVSCTPIAGSPFTIKNTGVGTEVDFGVLGCFHANGGADFGCGSGAYTTQQVGQTVLQILTQLQAGGPFTATYSANFVSAAVPEPITLLTFGAGSLLAFRRRRRQA
jgi:hypothetical protein